MSRPLFTARSTTVFRAMLAGVVLSLGTGALAYYHYYRGWYWSPPGVAPDQPVLFSHRHHAGDLRIDCRYCHVSVETSSFAGVPSTHTCLTCHSQIFTATAMLAPVVASATQDRPLVWNRVNDLPDHVYFNHSIHIAKGVACTTCHGDVGGMALTQQGRPLEMRWCLDCHRHPAPRLEPERARVFAPHPTPAPTEDVPAERALALYRERFIHTEHLDNCSTCHR
jgi:hypothetical protein